MARKHELREQRTGTVINVTSKKQESDITLALQHVVRHLSGKFEKKIDLIHQSQWYLKDIVSELRETFPDVDFHYHFDTSSIRPDGGILSIRGRHGDTLTYPILIAEVKNQGTNDLRALEGKPKQAKGNAIERLGKNLVGLRTALMRESMKDRLCFSIHGPRQRRALSTSPSAAPSLLRCRTAAVDSSRPPSRTLCRSTRTRWLGLQLAESRMPVWLNLPSNVPWHMRSNREGPRGRDYLF